LHLGIGNSRGVRITYKAVIIGGGPGGYACALRLAQLGAKSAVIEEKALGGVCSNSGCIPVKALHASAKLLREMRSAGRHGISCGESKPDYDQMRKRALNISKISVKGIELLLGKAGVDVVAGRGKITSPDNVQVGNETLDAQNIVIATGSEPVQIPGVPFDAPGGRVLSSETLLELGALPETMVIVGGGYVGIEYASIFSSFESKITVVEMMDRILPGMDPEITDILKMHLSKDGIEVMLGARIEKITGDGVLVNGENIAAERVLVSVGRRPSFDKAGMNAAGVKYERGIITDNQMRTSAPGIYALGDVVGKGMLAHVASHEGLIAAENIMGMKSRMDYSCIPSCVFSFPEIAAVGSINASPGDPALKTGRFPFAASGKARAMGHTEGMVKVFVNDGILVGTVIIGPNASDLIGEACIAVKNRLKVDQITGTVHPHPVLSEAFVEACLDAGGIALNK
jgi:dihydrolipoamide dehydrogenase